MNTIVQLVHSAFSIIWSWLKGVLGDLIRFIFWILRGIRKGLRIAIAIALLTIIWLAVGAINRMYDFWDDDPERGAMIANDDKFGDDVSSITYLDQGWAPEDSLWFYNATQGSNLLPYDFFLALEQAESDALFRDANNINHYGYLPQKKTFSNPDALPVGMTRDTYQGKAYMGFTCAACHTNQINHNGIGIRIDGAPAGSDMENFMIDLGAAMQTTLSNPAKRDRFIAKVIELGDYSSSEKVLDDLEKYANRIVSYTIVNDPKNYGRPETTYGYYRLDAFGRIFNRVLEHILSADQIDHVLKTTLSPEKYSLVIKDVRPVLESKNRNHLIERIEGTLATHLSSDEILELRNKIFNPADAPVSYPFLWDTPQHDYVQWNGIVQNSKVGPLGRNAGQVIGVFGTLDWQEKPGSTLSSFLGGQGLFSESHISFRSSIDIRNLRRVEDQLRKLTSPAWPENILGKLDKPRMERGRVIFNEYCQSCHMQINPKASDRRVIANMSSLDSIQTDKKMSDNSINFNGYSGILENQYVEVGPGNILLEPEAPVAALLTSATRNVIATPDPDKLFIRRWAERIFDIIFTIGDNPVQPSMKKGNYTPDTSAQPLASLKAYKGRSLNGIWATAPYLHNGSIPTLYDLLLPKKPKCDEQEQTCTDMNGEYRPDTFVVGSRTFDLERIGFKSEGYDGFVFDTSVHGNDNGGHEYAAGKTAQPNGEILPALNREQRLDLLEYLKSL